MVVCYVWKRRRMGRMRIRMGMGIGMRVKNSMRMRMRMNLRYELGRAGERVRERVKGRSGRG